MLNTDTETDRGRRMKARGEAGNKKNLPVSASEQVIQNPGTVEFDPCRHELASTLIISLCAMNIIHYGIRKERLSTVLILATKLFIQIETNGVKTSSEGLSFHYDYFTY